ncbi:MAG: hypothetical protein Q9184_004020 [Pyrenodesmia sp. 2 TL-2023]
MSIKMGSSLESAQAILGLSNGFASDSEVLALFWAKYSSSPKEFRENPSALALDHIGALQTIAIRQKSRLLHFVLTILPHLTDHNNALPPVDEQNVNLIGHEPTDVDLTLSSNDTLHNDSPLHPADEPLAPSNGALDGDELESLCASRVTEESDSSADIPSSSEEDSISDFSDEDNGRYYDGQKWCCEDCDEPLAHCDCTDGPSNYPCPTCASEAADMEFCTKCSNCHRALEGPCSECQLPEGTTDPSELFWDQLEKVWRCALCFWEVEADNADEGRCHCPSEQDPHFRRRIELAEYPEYGPADSDSSVADSADSEPDSGDEEFVEEDGPIVMGFANLLAGNYDPFEKMASPGLGATGITGEATMGAGGEAMDTGGDT